ncbi:MAG: aminotransferase class I/II-fold pyridoxal phosphate-dependent enzyme [Victivallaceae bacterium]|nr:aminotransferase class I/II-fold pyridoxal phosphate-dependent enzyme [Victivallaceae bacterium]
MNDLKTFRKERLARHIATLPKSGIREFFELANNMTDVISLGVGEPDFVTPKLIRQAAIDSLEQGRTSYTSNLGLYSLRKEICKYLEKDYGCYYRPDDECLVTVGVSEAFDLAIRAITNPGDEIIYFEPCFVSYNVEIKMAHGIPVASQTSEENEFSVDIEDVKKKITPKTKAIILNFPCNPTGGTLNLAQMQAIAELAIEHDLIVITDEIYSELTYEGQLPSIASLPGMKERCILLHGFSKAFAMTGFRIGYACGPIDIIGTMMKIHQYAIMSAPTLAQYAAEEALKNGRPEMEKMRETYRQRRDLMVQGMNDAGLHCFMPKGAFYTFPSIKSTGLSSKDFAMKFLEQHKVAVIPGTAFGACGEGYVRCCYATSTENIQEALRRMKIFVKSLK